jgi:hypothetical protein
VGYLQLKHNSRIIFDPTYPNIDQNASPTFEWTEFYGNVEEAISLDMHPPLGKDVDLHMMVAVTMRERKLPDTLVLDLSFLAT